MAIVGVLPAAGYATRLQPLEGSKETIEIGGRRVIDYAIDRMQRAGCSEIRIVTRPEKEDVVAHAKQRGTTLVLGRPESSSASFALGIDGLESADIVLLGWPDILWDEHGDDAYAVLVEAVETGSDIAMGLFKTRDDLSRWDTVVVDEDGRVTGVYPKSDTPASTIVWAPAAARRWALEGIAASEWPGSHFHALCGQGAVVTGIQFPGECTDIGTPHDLERALAGHRTGPER